MAERNVDVVSDGWSYLECPRWHEGRLWVSDFYTEKVVAIDDAGHHEVMAQVPEQPSGLGFLPDGRALIVSMRDHRILRREDDGSLVEHADLSGLVADHLNDMVVDARGGAYVGNFGFDLMGGAPISSTTLTYVDPDGVASTVADDLLFPNGMVLRDGVLVVAETFGARLTAFDVADDGGLARRRSWARFAEPPATTDVGEAVGALPVAPDGICADADGAIWVADALHGRLLRVAEGGEILEELPTGTGVYACMLGGEDGRTLYACAAPSFAEHERRPVREAQLLAARVDVPHAGVP
ncbi:SMP-30/gluconolactonase/LRE family protein [Actinomycetospora callitridis]|uniref:SMP-30/gluconolactonase/LRE family protein n=1 Tax=Actinomycetospora callitridis TaxID=913944 RepID=UPI002365BBFC|nr:SMP-30/gluconolactonase/LRE family protein [Actinomycetospora callitridis]MDD7917455.1 SMP-30/gluconolactonase/LRE family protein [Actinomycetospora callitridis]